jgi:hypothetical protein
MKSRLKIEARGPDPVTPARLRFHERGICESALNWWAVQKGEHVRDMGHFA